MDIPLCFVRPAQRHAGSVDEALFQ
jgi:hypothetical protein